MGGGGEKERVMVREKGVGEVWGKLGELWLGGGRKNGYGSRDVYISTKGAILGFARDFILEGFPGPRRGPQVVPWAAEERVPELALAQKIVFKLKKN